MNAKEKNPYLIFETLNSTLNKEEIQELAWLFNEMPGKESPLNQTIAGNKPCDSSEKAASGNSDSTYQYSTEEVVAKKLGLCKKTLQNLRKRKEINFHKMGRQIRYSPEDVREYEMKTQVKARKKVEKN